MTGRVSIAELRRLLAVNEDCPECCAPMEREGGYYSGVSRDAVLALLDAVEAMRKAEQLYHDGHGAECWWALQNALERFDFGDQA